MVPNLSWAFRIQEHKYSFLETLLLTHKKQQPVIQLWPSMTQMFLAPSEGKVMKAILSLGTALVAMLTLLKYISWLLKLKRQQLSRKEILTRQWSFQIKYKISGVRTCSIKFPALEVHTSLEILSSLRWWGLLFTAPRRRVIYICILSHEIWEWWRVFLSDNPCIPIWIKITWWSLYLNHANTKIDWYSVAR